MKNNVSKEEFMEVATRLTMFLDLQITITQDNMRILGLRVDCINDFARDVHGFRVRSYSPHWNIDHSEDAEVGDMVASVNRSVRRLLSEYLKNGRSQR